MDDLKAIIESLLFVTDRPLGVEKLAEIIEEADGKAIRAALEALLEEFNNPGRGFRLHEVAGGYQFRTHPECQAYIRRMLKPTPSRLSRAALETLAIIAYKQPIIRSDIEHIRGVDSGGVLRVLMEKKLIRVLGRREIPGRPLIYATTKHFLEVFDLKNLKDLPTPKEIEELTAQETDVEAQSVGDNQPTISPEAATITAEQRKETDAVTLADGKSQDRENLVAGVTVSAVETPNPSDAPGIDTAESGAAAANEVRDEASNEVSIGEVTDGLREWSDGETAERLIAVADEASFDASNDVSADENTDEGTSVAPDHGGLGQDDADKTVGDNGETAI